MSGVLFREISKTYGTTQVLRKLSLAVEDGEFLTLLGPSGCGKSTLLRILAGLEPQDAGSVSIGGRVVDGLRAKQRDIAMVFQSYALYPHMTVAENIGLPLKMRQLSFWQRLPLIGCTLPGTSQVRAAIETEVTQAANAVGIGHLLARKPGQLSGGQRQRVAIGRALVRDVDVFLFDEPLSNLDAKLRSELRVEIKRLHQRLANTMIYVTHDQIEAMTLADRIAVMRGGVIQQLDAPQAIYNRPVNRFVAGFIGSPGMNFIDGRLEGSGDGWRFSAGDMDVPLSTYGFDKQPVTGPAVFGVRPEHIGLNSGTGWPFSAKATVDVVEPMGSDTLVWLRLGAQSLSVRVPSERAPQTGSQVEIGFDPIRASLFGEDGNRL